MFRRLWKRICVHAESMTVIELQRQVDEYKEETVPKLQREIAVLKHENATLSDVLKRDRMRVEAEMSTHAKTIADNTPGE